MRQNKRNRRDGGPRELVAWDGLAGIPSSAARAALRTFLARRGENESAPDRKEATEYLDALIAMKGRASGYAEFAWLQIAAAHVWGTAETAFFATVLREYRVLEKNMRKTEWERAEVAIKVLPAAWQAPMRAVLAHSRDQGRKRRGTVTWSASHILAVSRALYLWYSSCASAGHDVEPTGRRFEAFAEALTRDAVTPRSIHSYLQRVLSGYSNVISPGFSAPGCEFMISEFRALSMQSGSTTKRGQSGARELYALGFELMDDARAARVRGLRSALTFRDGLMISLAVALPQRARALSALEIGATIGLDNDQESIWINLPGSVLKQPEARKRTESYTASIKNAELWQALSEFLAIYRPIFDNGTALFPSKTAPGQGLSEGHIGRHVGDITHRELGVRTSIHRFRDSVATEAAEELENGGVLAPVLLGHRDQAVTARHYDHSEGIRIAREFADLTGAMKAQSVDLKL